MNQYANVYPVKGGFEVRATSVLPLGFHKTRGAAQRQALAINYRRSQFNPKSARCSRKDAA